MNPLHPLMLVVLLALSGFGQEPKYPMEQVALLKAESAELVSKPDHVLIIAKGLQQERLFGIKLTVSEETTKYIQVYNLVTVNGKLFASFPPTVYEPSSPGQYLILGLPGDKVGISIPTTIGPPVYQEAIIAPSIIPPPPEEPPPAPPGSYGSLIKVAAELADALNDPPTRKALASGYKRAVVEATGKSYLEAKGIVAGERKAALLARQGPSRAKDWETWRTEVDAELVKVVQPNDTVAYLAALSAIVSALER